MHALIISLDSFIEVLDVLFALHDLVKVDFEVGLDGFFDLLGEVLFGSGGGQLGAELLVVFAAFLFLLLED